jgi:ectoine hydroxylase-related dioxygenase (phytanoyl-CoA dioxygenase family)
MSRHKIHYEVFNGYNPTVETERYWEVDVHASPEELQAFAESGYMVREILFQNRVLQQLQDALDELEAAEWAKNRDEVISSPSQLKKQGWGLILRHLMDKHEVFLELLKFQPLLSIARAMMGPLVRLRGLSARISYPGDGRRHQTPWHQHLKVISNPLPPWFSRPHCIDYLIYLDDLNQDTGEIAVVPESHNWLDQASPGTYEPIEDEVVISIKAGGVVLIHGNLWHRALPTLHAKRRMLILELHANLVEEIESSRPST